MFTKKQTLKGRDFSPVAIASPTGNTTTGDASTTSFKFGKRLSRKKWATIIGSVSALVIIAVTVSLAVVFTQVTRTDKQRGPQVISIEIGTEPVQLAAGSTYSAPISSGGKIFILLKNASLLSKIYHDTPAGRSYDGSPWEAAPPLLMNFQCSSSRCEFTVPNDGGSYYIQPIQAPARSDEQLVADFLIQATFGPSRQTINSFPSGSNFTERVKAFILEQMASVPTLHRSYYRARVDPVLYTYRSGTIRGPCDAGSRWVRAVFDGRDAGSPITVNGTLLYVGGKLRTQVTPAFVASLQGNGPWMLCNFLFRSIPPDVLNGAFQLSNNGSSTCFTVYQPAMSFTTVQPSASRVINGTFEQIIDPPVSNTLLLRTPPVNCQDPGDYVAFSNVAGIWYRLSPRQRLIDNTLENPYNGSIALNPTAVSNNVPKTFLNEESCVVLNLSTKQVNYVSSRFFLNDTVLRNFYSLSNVYAYYITGLTPSLGPCASTIARFMVNSGTCIPGTASNASLNFISGLIQAASNVTVPGLKIIDIITAQNSICSTLPPGFQLRVNNTCWQHVHNDLYSVFDFSQWVTEHDGGPSHILGPASQGSAELRYPLSHPITRWQDHRSTFPLLGIFGHQVDFINLPPSAQRVDIARFLRATNSTSSSIVEHCGSPGEVQNEQWRGNRFSWGGDINLLVHVDNYYSSNVRLGSKHFVWANVVLKGRDQLRQRIAWALSQIFVVEEIDLSSFNPLVECWATYYDIFVRNAFGNYLDVMKEVTYSPMMGYMLTYRGSISYEKSFTVPDENYARELMQLFSIGLYKLNRNGTVMLDKTGAPIETYTTADIQSFARVWTGLDLRPSRGNVENAVVTDPMRIIVANHDSFPKQGLDGFHIGDEYPLCRNLPSRAFLRRGSKYRFLGASPNPVMLTNPSLFDLEVSSPLYKTLCNANSNGACQLRSVVTLSENLQCSAIECDVDVIRVIRVKITPSEFVYYEYIQVPCVELEFPEMGQITVTPTLTLPLCVDPRSIKAAPRCRLSQTSFVTYAKYAGEVSSSSTAVARCTTLNGTTPSTPSLSRVWTNDSCSMMIQVFSDGRVSLVQFTNKSYGTVFYGLQTNSNVKFRVNWEGKLFPTVDQQCGTGCSVFNDTCLCGTNSSSTVVFTNPKIIPEVSDILDQLHIGAANPAMFDNGTYSVFFQDLSRGLLVYVDSTRSFNEKTIFEIRSPRGSRVRYLANLKAVVKVGNQYQFRNPPNFIQHEEPTRRDVEYEIDAVLKHLLHHSNTGPFIAKFMINRFVTSNPSPAYIEVVAEAFTSGSYMGIGSGVTGDLSATIAAVLLHRESLSSAIKSDISHGRFQEPLMKVVQLMRALEAVPKNNREIALTNLVEFLSQQPYAAPSVFNFFKPNFQPVGSLVTTGLYAPESQLLTSPRIMAFLDSLMSLIEYGGTECYSLVTSNIPSAGACANFKINPTLASAYTGVDLSISNITSGLSSFQIVEQLSTLFTGGRLNEHRKNMMVKAWEDINSTYSKLYNGNQTLSTLKATKSAIQLLTVAPEFQVSSMAQPRNVSRKFSQKTGTYNATDYKAIVYIFLLGGMDSWKLLTPHSGCGSFDLYQQYLQIRTASNTLSLNDMLVIDSTNGPQQPCQKFGVHPNAPFLKQLYNASEAAFITNIGTLVEPLNIDQWKKRSKQRPVGLFAHDVQQLVQMNMDASSLKSKGILGRIQDELTRQGVSAAGYSVTGSFSKALEGDAGVSPTQQIINSATGIRVFDQNNVTTITPYMRNLTQLVTDSMFSDTWNDLVQNCVDQSAFMKSTLKDAVLDGAFNYSNIAAQFGYVSRVVASREKLKVNRQMFNVELTGFDTHGSFTTVDILLKTLDTALSEFVAEMKKKDVWDKMTIVVASDFARTLRSNGAGTDHAWGGNSFIAGGSVKGGKILGQYPSNFAESGQLNIGNGILLPTTPWEAMWNGVGLWFGVGENAMNTILPNRPNFLNGSLLFSRDTLFK